MTELIRRHGRKKASLTEGEGTAGGLSLRHLATMAATAALTLGLAACSSGADGGRDLETASFQAGAVDDFGLQLADLPDQSDFVGAIVADEPRAALAAREVLENGGTAVDAITALYFQLSVTMPHAAGLGGGGLCLVHDPDSREVTSYNFLARRSRAGGPVAIPGNVRGFALMHAVHGSAQWSSLVTPAEVLAAQGHEVSRAFARELAPLAPALRTRPALAGIYLKPTGAPLQEGDMLVQPELAAALGQSAPRTAPAGEAEEEDGAGGEGACARLLAAVAGRVARLAALGAVDEGAARAYGAVFSRAAAGRCGDSPTA